jgi:hypothetical protein
LSLLRPITAQSNSNKITTLHKIPQVVTRLLTLYMKLSNMDVLFRIHIAATFLGFLLCLGHLVSFLQLTRSSQRVTQRAAKIREPAVAKFREPVYFSHFCLSALRTAWGNIYLHCVVLKLWKSDNEEMLCSKVNMQREHTYYASFFPASAEHSVFNFMNVCRRIMMRSRHVLCLAMRPLSICLSTYA